MGAVDHDDGGRDDHDGRVDDDVVPVVVRGVVAQLCRLKHGGTVIVRYRDQGCCIAIYLANFSKVYNYNRYSC